LEALGNVPNERAYKDKERVYRKVPAEIVRVRNLRKYYGKVLALEIGHFDFDGGICVIRGPNGSGKSTFLGILSGLIKPSVGEVRVFGKDPYRENIRGLIGFVGHKTFLFEDLSGYDNWRFFGNFNVDLAEILGISHILKRPVRTYSRGERVKLSVGIELSREKPLLLLDEPFSPLDERSRLILSEILKGKNVIITAHGEIPIKPDLEYNLR
jgi:ABC-type multidrug transport system ATPase subunit